MSLDAGSAPPGEQPEALVQQDRHLGGTQGDSSGSGEFDRQRNAIQASTHLGHGTPVLMAESEARPRRFGSLEEETARRNLRQLLDGDLKMWDLQRANPKDPFPCHIERFPARRENLHLSARQKQAFH